MFMSHSSFSIHVIAGLYCGGFSGVSKLILEFPLCFYAIIMRSVKYFLVLTAHMNLLLKKQGTDHKVQIGDIFNSCCCLLIYHIGNPTKQMFTGTKIAIIPEDDSLVFSYISFVKEMNKLTVVIFTF